MAAAFAKSAHECAPPVEIATALGRPLTNTGVEDVVVLPFPNWPEPFAPQHLTVPPADNAHECEPPAAIATAPATPLTLTAVDAFVVVPLPN